VPRCGSCLSDVPEGRYCLACGQALPASSEVPTRLESLSPVLSSPSVDHGRFVPGMQLAGRYRIVAPLGKGGMGEVYRADDLKLGQAVALKFLPEAVEQDERRLALLLNEVRTARQISHPNVCRVYDIGEVDGHHFLSMEYVDGEDLASLLRRIGRLPKDKGIQIARQIGAGLGAAHEAGVLHRDLKPANIMIDGRGRVRITDFGLAAAASEIGSSEARAGTPAYMAPEQLAGKAFTVRSDLYALGLVLYELFTGRPAFKASTPTDLLRLQTSSTPAPPSSVVEGLEPSVERAILRCLDPDPALRPSSALAVISALPGGDPLAAALAAGETPSPQLVAAAGESTGLPHRVAVAALAAILGGIALLLALSGQRQGRALARLEKPPAVLAERAREILHDLGYTERPADSLAGFDANDAYLKHLSEAKQPQTWSRALARDQPAIVRFRYRQSPRLLERINVGSMGDLFSDPPPTLPGMAEVTLDPQGRLIAFTAVPQPICRSGKDLPDPDWTKVLTAAGFDPSALTAADPLWAPPLFADRRVAWTGAYPGAKEIPVRLEAAALAGRPVAFRVAEPWDLTEEQKGKGSPSAARFRAGSLVGTAVFFIAVTMGLIVALRNLRQGRGDRKGALRFAVYLGTVRLLWLVGAHHLSIDSEADLLIGHLAWSMYRVGMVCIFYLALEPYARRLWPRMLVSWMRLLDGRFRDPLVGRDALFGCLAGVALALNGALCIWMAERLALAEPAPGRTVWTLESLRGFPQAFASVLGIHVTGVLEIFFPLMLLLLSRIVLGRTWIAIAITSVVGLVISYDGSESVVLHLVGFSLSACLFWVALFRFGLLGAIVTISVADLLGQMPLTADLTAWYATPTLITLIAAVGLALWSFRASLAGHPLFRDAILADQAPA